jgi:uncharacterized protein (TIGR00288 family)
VNQLPTSHGAALRTPPATVHNAALLIDFDNVTMGIRSDLQTQLRRLLNSEVIRGKVAVQRAYADWRRYPQYIVPLSEASIDLIFAPAFGANKKNATDIRLAIDALELVFTRPEIGTFILLSGDSDFSSLVLKLKEYGKYVVGVGIRESASDLLVQNCDEYYSYNELTGLSRESDAEALPRDPWEVAVEAAVRMRDTGDVMRSDRLKQVMQEIDPHFDEKDVGMNKFSKFVAEAARRGLLVIEKMENGQYEVDLGPEANVRLGEPASKPASESSRQPRRRRGPAGPRTAPKGMTLAAAFALLREALERLDGDAVSPQEARDQMRDLSDEADDPVFEAGRFQRLLRQAHDASVIDLAKDGDEYVVKLRPAPAEPADDSSTMEHEVPSKAIAEARRENARKKGAPKSRGRSSEGAGKIAPAGADAEASDQKDEAPKKATKRKSRKRSTSKKAPAAETANEKVEGTGATAGAESGTTEWKGRRSIRGRSGSRGRPTGGTRVPAEESAAAEPTDEKEPSIPSTTGSTSKRSVRGRGGSRSRASRPDSTGTAATNAPASPVTPSPPAAPATRAAPAEEPAARGGELRPESRTSSEPASQKPRDAVAPEREPERVPAKSAHHPSKDDKAAADDGGLLKRMTAAFQRAVLGQDDD